MHPPADAASMSWAAAHSLGPIGCSGRKQGPHGGALDAEALGEVGDGNDDAAAEADTREVAAADELVRSGAADAKNLRRLLDGEGERLVRPHAHVGSRARQDFAATVHVVHNAE
jgi:hypothetical protein